MPEQSRLEQLLEKQRKLEADIDTEKGKEEAIGVLNGIGADVAKLVQQGADKAKVDVKVLHGKFFALTVDEAGKLSVEVTTKTRKANGGTTASNGNANGNGQYEYFLADGRGAFPDIQSAMVELGIPEANRPKHNRYDRLSAEWKLKIIRKAKAEAKPAEAEAKPAEAEAKPAEAESKK